MKKQNLNKKEVVTNVVIENVETVDNVNEVIAVVETKSESLDTLNFDSLIKKAEKRKSIYKYSVEILQSKDFKDEQKKFRKKLRNLSIKQCLTVFEAFKEKDEAKKESAVNSFNSFYKENFNYLDFSFESFSQVSIKESPEMHKLFSVVLSLVKEFNKEKEIVL
jgi:hypothetical protein